jgi:hypothetical protein
MGKTTAVGARQHDHTACFFRAAQSLRTTSDCQSNELARGCKLHAGFKHRSWGFMDRRRVIRALDACKISDAAMIKTTGCNRPRLVLTLKNLHITASAVSRAARARLILARIAAPSAFHV